MISRLAKSLSSSGFPSTFRLVAELGRSTDTGFVDGKTLEKSVNPHLSQPKLAKAMAAIASSHQKQAFNLSRVNMLRQCPIDVVSAISKCPQVNLQSQEAYELAAKGPVKPAQTGGQAVIYSMK